MSHEGMLSLRSKEREDQESPHARYDCIEENQRVLIALKGLERRGFTRLGFQAIVARMVM